MSQINIVGAGLAGSEAAYQLAKRGFSVRLFEMRPVVSTPAHQTGNLAELVCSNTFKSLAPHSAPGILKTELKSLGSLIINSAHKAQVPAGEALAVDREVFSNEIQKNLLDTGRVEIVRKKIESLEDLPPALTTILATGPLTQGGLQEVLQHSGQVTSHDSGCYFYDAIAPIVDASSIDQDKVFAASRYGKSTDDYLNCPMTKEEYLDFYQALMAAEKTPFHDFEEPKYFQGCQPIEAIAETGVDSLRFGPMKPVGLTDPKTGRWPYAVVQLRIDNISRTAYNIVGFQTKLKYGEQVKVFQKIPGLEKAEFLRLGSVHRNTYICAPLLLNSDFSFKPNPNLRIAGQITGVEGYTESSAIGLLVALSIAAQHNKNPWVLPPRESALGALCHYLFHSSPKDFQPVNVHFGLFDRVEALAHIRDKKLYRLEVGKRAITALEDWKSLNAF